MRSPICFTLFFGIIVFSCCKKEQATTNTGKWQYTDCSDPAIFVVFPLYDSTQVDTVIVRRFVNDNTFSAVVDSSVIDSPYTYSHGDYNVYSDNRLKYMFLNGYDYELYIPAIDTTIRISNINTEKTRDSLFISDGRGRSINCSNKLNEFNITINGVSYNFYNDNNRFLYYYWDHYIVFRKGYLQ